MRLPTNRKRKPIDLFKEFRTGKITYRKLLHEIFIQAIMDSIKPLMFICAIS